VVFRWSGVYRCFGRTGATVTATAVPITDPARVQEVVEKFRAKCGAGQVAAYYSKLYAAVEVSLPASAA
jgi:hypothetical protein